MIWIAEPRVNGFGFITEAVTKDVAATQCATNFNGGGAQQSTTVKVIFFPSTNGLVELVILRPFFIKCNARPPGKKKLAPVTIKFNILTSPPRNSYPNFC